MLQSQYALIPYEYTIFLCMKQLMSPSADLLVQASRPLFIEGNESKLRAVPGGFLQLVTC